jgi:hypothetical protein
VRGFRNPPPGRWCAGAPGSLKIRIDGELHAGRIEKDERMGKATLLDLGT